MMSFPIPLVINAVILLTSVQLVPGQKHWQDAIQSWDNIEWIKDSEPGGFLDPDISTRWEGDDKDSNTQKYLNNGFENLTHTQKGTIQGHKEGQTGSGFSKKVTNQPISTQHLAIRGAAAGKDIDRRDNVISLLNLIVKHSGESGTDSQHIEQKRTDVNRSDKTVMLNYILARFFGDDMKEEANKEVKLVKGSRTNSVMKQSKTVAAIPKGRRYYNAMFGQHAPYVG